MTKPAHIMHKTPCGPDPLRIDFNYAVTAGGVEVSEITRDGIKMGHNNFEQATIDKMEAKALEIEQENVT